jgi:PEP-CTERM motif
MKNSKYLLPALFTGALALAQTSVLADSAAMIESQASGSAATYDDNGTGNYPVITTILSAPVGALDGYTYGNWAYLAADTTGSLDIFYSSTANNGSETVPTVGDTITVAGTYSPFDGIPEVAKTGTAITVNGPGSQGNPPYAPGAPVVTTIPTINVGTTLPAGAGVNASGLAGYYLQLNNVTIGASGNFPTHANLTTTLTDQGGNSMTMFFWASSYSTDGALGGTAIPQGLVDVTGFVDDFYTSSTGVTSAEFVPMSFTVVPEPTAMALSGLGSLLALAGYRLRKKA